MEFWYQTKFKDKFLTLLLWPLACLFAGITALRRKLFQKHIFDSYISPKPVVVVGNLSVGGNGKTPVTIWLVQYLQLQGIKSGVISRGYGSHSNYYPRLVEINDNPIDVGDEPLLIKQRTNVPVCIGANRQQSIELLLKEHDCDVIISDDGLQHYQLQRDFEIVVVDGKRGFGNGKLLPAGPLREGLQRLEDVDLVIENGNSGNYSDTLMQLEAKEAVNILTAERIPLMMLARDPVNAIAGIGYPQRFFSMLENLGFTLSHTQAFADHQTFTHQSFSAFSSSMPLLMTEKDAVKCHAFAKENWWYVPVEAEIDGGKLDAFLTALLHKMRNENE